MDLDWVSFKRDSITSLDSLPFILIRATGELRLIPDAGHTLDCHRVNIDRQSTIHTHIQSMVESKPTAPDTPAQTNNVTPSMHWEHLTEDCKRFHR